jgi:hypothetical protein
MAYTIIKSNGTVLTTIADGTINTTSTSLGLPGRNFAGYGQALDTNFVHQLENFADSSPPPNPIRGQLWYNTNTSTLYVCPADGETNAANWLALASTSSGGTTTFGSVTVQGTLQANLVTAINSVTAADGIFTNLAVSGTSTMTNANINSAGVGSLTTTIITTGSASTPGTLTGAWTVSGMQLGNAMVVNDGNIYASVGIKVDPNNFYDLTGNVIPIGYSNVTVASYLPTYTGIVGTGAAIFRGTSLTTGANTTAGTITGNWTLSAGSNLRATTAGTVTTAAQPNITSVGILTSLSISGNANVGNIGATNGVFTNISGNGAALTGLNASNLSSGTVLSGRISGNYTGITGTGVLDTGSITSNFGNINIGTSVFSGNGSGLTGVTADTVTTAAQPNITSVGNLTSLSVTGNVNIGNISASANNNNKLTTGIFQTISGDVIAPPSPNSATIFTLDTQLNPFSKWIITVMPGFATSESDLVNWLTATFEVSAVQNAGGPTYAFSKLTNNPTFINLEFGYTTTTLIVKIYNTLTGGFGMNADIKWSALRLI